MRDAMGEGVGLSGSGTGDDQQGRADCTENLNASVVVMKSAQDDA
jgi:hypothetical protein